jgi:integrase
MSKSGGRKRPKKQRWPGGYIHQQEDGRQLFIIEKRVRGERFHVSTRCHNWTAAMKQLERFEADPLAYSPAGAHQEEPIRMTDDLLAEYQAWQLGQGVTKKHSNEMNNRLADWMEDFAGADLRRITLRDHIKPALTERVTCRPHRIIALKGFYAWLRKEKHLLTSAQDPTLDLPVPQAVPEQRKRRKAVPIEHVRAALKKLAPAYRDLLLVLSVTGWHVTELERFTRSEESDILEPDGEGLARLAVRHKIGTMHHTTISDPDALAAAERLRKRGAVPRRPNQALKKACKAARVPPFTFGVMRHSVATWAVKAKANPADVAAFLGHKDPRTTRKFYVDQAVAPPQVPLPPLYLVKGGR